MSQNINRISYAGVFITDPSKVLSLIPEEFKKKDNYKEMIHPNLQLFYWTYIPLEYMKYVLNNNEQSHTLTIDGVAVKDSLVALKVSSCLNKNNESIPKKRKNYILLATASDYNIKHFKSLGDKDFTSITPSITLDSYCRIIYKKNEKQTNSNSKS